MIHLTRSHNLNILSAALAEKLTETAPDDPFVSQKIIVPNLDTARWFKLFAAEKNGIAANLECMLPAEWLWMQIRKIYPDLLELLPSDLQPMKWSLYQLLSDENVREKFSVIDRYVQSQPIERREQSIFQLAGQIASVFDEYLVYRPEMVLQWQKGHSGKGDEKWQSELWRMMNKTWKNAGDETEKNGAELYNELTDALSNQSIDMNGPLFALNPGLLPRPIINILKKIGKQSGVFVYQIQMTKGFENNLNELVQAFGRESNNVAEVINILEPDETINLHHERSGNHPLNRIQTDILNGNSVSNLLVREGEIPGIEIRSCHSPLREIEVLHEFLLEKFEDDPSLHPDDILVVTPDVEIYRPYIKAVFDHTESHLPRIPYHAGYSPGSSEMGMERALLRLLSLIDSRFEFAGVIDLFRMKPVYHSFGISDSDTAKLERWIEENHVVWGLDAEHRKEFGQPAEDLETWNSAYRRGWNGHIHGGEEGDIANGVLLYQSIRSTNDQQIWAAFSSYLNQLADMRTEIKRRKTCLDWSDWITDRMESLFDEAGPGRDEMHGIKRIIGRISEQYDAAKCNTEIPFTLFKSELVSMLDRQKASGALFTKGVTFSSMVPVRSIPFKVIALIGLNENSFPRKQIAPDFDLMTQQPLPGERNRKNEDRNLFLESVMAAGNVHYCSYIGQSQVDNEEIPPSTVVSEWADVLSHAAGIDVNKVIKKEALSGFSPVNFESNRSFSETYFRTARNLLNDEDAISGLRLDHPIPEEESNDPIQLDELVRFYSNPIRWFMKKRFEVLLRDAGTKKDEFILNHLEKHLLFQRVFGWILDGMPDQQIQKYLVQSGAVPAGWPGERRSLELINNAGKAISVLKDARIDPRLDQYPLSLQVNSTQLEGNLTSYSTQQFVDVNPSEFSGKVAIHSWIKHLCGTLAGHFDQKTSILFSELKSGNPKKITFGPPENSDDILSELIDFYRHGLIEPQTFFPKTLYAFEERERDENKSGSYFEAAKAFNTDDYSIGENNDPVIKTLLGEDVEFQNEFITDRYRQIIGRMMDHMEEVGR